SQVCGRRTGRRGVSEADAAWSAACRVWHYRFEHGYRRSSRTSVTAVLPCPRQPHGSTNRRGRPRCVLATSAGRTVFPTLPCYAPQAVDSKLICPVYVARHLSGLFCGQISPVPERAIAHSWPTIGDPVAVRVGHRTPDEGCVRVSPSRWPSAPYRARHRGP